MKIMFILLLIAICIFVTGMGFTKNDVRVRPIKIKVIDKKTKQPLSNVLVYYLLQTYKKDKVLGFIPDLEGKNVVINKSIKQACTNEEGFFEMREEHLFLSRNEFLYGEKIYINLDIDTTTSCYGSHLKDKILILDYNMARYFSASKCIYNPNSVYKGFYINSTTWKMDPKEYGGESRDKLTILWNGEGLNKSEESFVVELELKQ